MSETHGLYGPRTLPLAPDERSLAGLIALALPGIRGLLRAVCTTVAFLSTLAIVALNAHAPLDIKPGLLGEVLASNMPLIAAVTAAFAVRRPWPAFLVVLLLTPFWDAAQVSWQVERVQVILQTIFVIWLGIGYLLRDREPARSIERRERASGPAARRTERPVAARTASARALDFAGRHLGPLATVVLLALASISTLASPDVEVSGTVLIHGIIEPVAMGLLLLAFRPGRRQLMLVLLALGLSVALGSIINIVQSIPAYGTLSSLQAKRLLFSRLTYFNVGLFGEMLAMAAPLLLGAIALRRQLGLGRYAVLFLTAALAVGAAGLFLTFSKSAYLATAGGVVAFSLLLAHTSRARLKIVAASLVLSAVVVPWPVVILQVSPTLENVYRDAMVSLVGNSRYDSWDPAKLSGHGSLVERALATEAAVRMAADHPLFGIGLDQFYNEYQGEYKSPDSHFAADSAHTFWPEIAAELGIPALIVVVLIFASALLALWRIYLAPPDAFTRLLAVTLLASLAAWLVVATAFAGDMYRPWRNMSSDFVMMAVLTAAAFALARAVRTRELRASKAAEESGRG